MRILFVVAFTLVGVIPSRGELAQETLNSSIKNLEGVLHAEYQRPKSDTTLVGKGKYWGVRMVKFYDHAEFLGSYLIFTGPSEEFSLRSPIRIPQVLEDFNRVVIEENFWRLLTLASHDPSVIEQKFAPIWRAKSTLLPGTEKELFNKEDPQIIFLTKLKDLPDYYPLLKRNVPSRAWWGEAHAEYVKK